MAGAVRFSTDELATLASRIAEAAEQALALEARAVRRDGARWRSNMPRRCRRIADALAVLDVAAALGELAVAARYVRPEDRRQRSRFKIARGRHPVVEAALQAITAQRLRAQ